MAFKIGAYIRVSTEEQASAIEGSLVNQKYRLKAFLDLKNAQAHPWGHLIDFYIDDGFSAKDTRRPAYQRMMLDIKRKKIDMILVSDLSRLSRNILDFCGLMDELEKNEAQFLSIKEQFDSSTPAGKMMIYNMINLAQFEREQISERVALGVYARAMRGLLNGARPILGYDKDPKNSGSYIINEAEADIVRKIFRHYLNTGSRAKTIVELEKEGIKPKLSGKLGRLKINDTWSCETLGHLLKSPAYIGYLEVNKRNKSKDQSKLKAHQQYNLVKASWDGIVSPIDFYNVQRLLEEALKQERDRLDRSESRIYLLSGVLRCSECGGPLIGQVSHGSKKAYHYYGHNKAHHKHQCSVQRVEANEVEELVLNYIWNTTQEAGYLEKIEKTIREMNNLKSFQVGGDKRKVNEELKVVGAKIDSLLFIQQKDMTIEMQNHIMSTFQSLSQEKAILEKKLADLSRLDEKEDRVKESVELITNRLNAFYRGFQKSNESMKKRLIRGLLKQVVVSNEGLHVFVHLADGFEVSARQLCLIRYEADSSANKMQYYLGHKDAVGDSNLSVFSSVISKNGDSGTIRTCDPLLRREMLYPAELRNHLSDKNELTA